MKYEELEKKLTRKDSELSLNRKEEFYTATVLPSLLFHNGLSTFYRIFRRIEEFPRDIDRL